MEGVKPKGFLATCATWMDNCDLSNFVILNKITFIGSL